MSITDPTKTRGEHRSLRRVNSSCSTCGPYFNVQLSFKCIFVGLGIGLTTFHGIEHQCFSLSKKNQCFIVLFSNGALHNLCQCPFEIVILFPPFYIGTMTLHRIEGIIFFWCCIGLCWCTTVQDIIGGKL